MQPRYSCRRLMLTVVAALLCTAVAWAQVETTGSIVGTVYDPTGAVVPGVKITVRDVASGATYTATTNNQGGYRIPQLKQGGYEINAEKEGFRQALVSNLTVEVARTATANITLVVGQKSEMVTVEAQAAMLETQDTSITSTITGRQITELPLPSRDANDLALMMPEAQTTGRPRTSTFVGLPKGAINISIDGINVQDNYLKSSDGFFTSIRPRLDAISEFTISSATPGAESAGEGAVQINMVTQRGSDAWHGGVWWYHRNPATNAIPFFDKLMGNQTPRLLLNQWGGKAGGFLIPRKLFFFGSYDEFRLPQSVSRTPTILTPAALSGQFTYNVAGTPRTVDLLALAAANGYPSTIDPSLQQAFNLLNKVPGTRVSTGNPIVDQIQFVNASSQIRRFPEGRLDWNVTNNHALEVVYKYDYFYSSPDTLNSRDPAFPGFPLQAGQYSGRKFGVAAVRSILTNTLTNEFRVGFQNAGVNFAGDIDLSKYPTVAGFGQIRPLFPTSTGALMTNPLLSPSWSYRNTPTKHLMDNVVWVHGNHAAKFGGTLTKLNLGLKTNNAYGAAIPNVSFGVNTADPASAMFSTVNFPGSATTDRTNARALYGLITGRVTSLAGATYMDPQSRQFKNGEIYREELRQYEWGVYATDSWRATPDLTLNYGVRYELQLPPTNLNNIFTAAPGLSAAYGASGIGNMFRPGTLAGSSPKLDLLNGRHMYNVDTNNVAPSFGFAWNPRPAKRLLNTLMGEGKTVLRGGYSIAYSREGLANVDGVVGANAGGFAIANLTSGVDFPDGSILLRNGLPSPSLVPPSPSFPLDMRPFMLSGKLGLNTVAPALVTPYVQSWNFGIQRELWKELVFEARYVGNHAVKLWRQVDFNEINVFENGFLSEFNAARNNLAIFRAANPNCGTPGNPSCSYANTGLPGQVNLPIMAGAFGTTTGFTNGTFIGYLNDGDVGRFAGALAGGASYFCRLVGLNSGDTSIRNQCLSAGYTGGATGFPLNFWTVNPDAELGGNYLLSNGAGSSYHGLQLIARRRMANGLLLNFNYTWSKSLSDFFAVSDVSFRNPRTLRGNLSDKGPAPSDIRHALKLNFLYELPFKSSNSILSRMIGGWQLNGLGRWQSGGPFLLNGDRFCMNRFLNTSAAVDCGVQLMGISVDQLQSAVGVYKDFANKKVFYLPSGYMGSDGKPNPQYIQPCNTPGQVCQRVFLYEPWFQRLDFAVLKKTAVTEKVNMEFRAEFMNIFNQSSFKVRDPNSNLSVGSNNMTATNASFGRIFNTYQDISTSNDLGSRQIQWVIRLNF